MYLRTAVSQIRESLKPDEDWAPVAFVVEPDVQVKIHTAVWTGDEERDAYFQKIADEALASRAIAVGMVNTIWYREVDVDEPTKPRPRDDPNRLEAVQVATMTADQTLLAHASITRHPMQSPTLGEWKVGDVEEGGVLTPVQESLRKVRDA